MTNGREMIPITVEEMKLYMLTDYGAYGRLLLHFLLVYIPYCLCDAMLTVTYNR